jgi:hypothetical protein
VCQSILLGLLDLETDAEKQIRLSAFEKANKVRLLPLKGKKETNLENFTFAAENTLEKKVFEKGWQKIRSKGP